MTREKEVKTLEALMDALEAQKQTVAHNLAETELILDRILDYQFEYKQLTGKYYHRKHYT